MNELCNTTNAAARIRKTLLTTASAFVLAAYGENVQAADNGRPTVWIEGGWHFESVTGKGEPFVPLLDPATRNAGLTSLVSLENALGRTYGAEGGISFQPNGSDWVFTASARYGRTQTTRRAVGNATIIGPEGLKHNPAFGVTTIVTPS